MKNNFLSEYVIDYVEIYTPMAKALAYWHTQALGFNLAAVSDKENCSSYLLKSNNINLVLTSSFPILNDSTTGNEVASFIARNYCGVKRFALKTEAVKEVFEQCVAGGAIPVKFPTTIQDELGYVEEAAIKLYDQCEIVFINRAYYQGEFKPGYKTRTTVSQKKSFLDEVDHIASELRINEINYWTNYLSNTIGTKLVQSIAHSAENKTGMVLNINQSADRKLTLVMAEPESYTGKSKVQQNIDKFGPGIHHLAFATDDIITTIQHFSERDVEFVAFPSSYYTLLRDNADFKGMDIDNLEKHGILIDKEGDTYLLQKFIKPISERPFFLYEIVQRVNGYNGFALKNINVLKKAEEIQIMEAIK